MGYLVALVIWSVAVGAFCYKVGFNYGEAAGLKSARISIYGS